MIPVDITNVGFLEQGGFFVFLRERGGERALPIFIGPLEAHSIASQFNNEPPPRPMTHDLCKSALDALGASVERVEVYDVVDNVFLGNVHLSCPTGRHVLDSRPSDAIALALRFNAPIFVSEALMDKSGVVVGKRGQKPVGGDEGPQPELTPLDRLQTELDLAVREERYEDAARLRDELRRLTGRSGGDAG